MKYTKLFGEFLFESFNESENESPKINITPQYADEKGRGTPPKKFDVNYQATVDGQELEIEGVLKPYHTGRGEDYEFEPGWFAEDADEHYYDEHSEEIEKQIMDEFYKGAFKK